MIPDFLRNRKNRSFVYVKMSVEIYEMTVKEVTFKPNCDVESQKQPDSDAESEVPIEDNRYSINSNGYGSLAINEKTEEPDDSVQDSSLTSPLLVESDDESSDVVVVKKYDESTESLCKTGFEVFIPYVIAGLGMVAAGSVLNVVQVRGMNFIVCAD